MASHPHRSLRPLPSLSLPPAECNPHLVRDSVVTYLRGSGATERELEALAIYMGHSVEMQRGTYDRRTKEQKVGGGLVRQA